jgi:hypothetical protein
VSNPSIILVLDPDQLSFYKDPGPSFVLASLELSGNCL